MSGIVAQIETALSQQDLRPRARALLLLNLCQIWSLVDLEKAKEYWESLEELSGELDADSQASYQALQDLFEPPEPPQPHEGTGTSPQVAAEIQTARAEAGENTEILKERLQAAEARLRQRWWWPFGLTAAWTALMETWATVDRAQALRLLPKVSATQQENLLRGLNRASKLSPEEWQAAAKVMHPPALMKLVEEILGDKNPLSLSPALATSVVNHLKTSLLAPKGEWEVENKRRQAMEQLEHLVTQVALSDPQTAQTILEQAILAGQAANLFTGDKGEFVRSFTYLRRIINLWARFPDLRESGFQFCRDRTPAPLLSFVLAQWHGILPQSLEEIPSHLQALLEDDEVTEKREAEAWCLVTLVRRGYEAEALRLARASTNQADLVPRIKRAWVCEHPETAINSLKREDFGDDLVGRFLFGTTQDRLAFLQQETEQGSRPLPAGLWSAPTFDDLLKIIQHKDPDPPSLSANSLYKNDTPRADQFACYLRLHGYTYYDYNEVDNYLLGALVAWRDDHPEQAEAVIKQMRPAMINTSDLNLDILRNIMFERCRNVLVAFPDAQFEFLDWFKKTFVDHPYIYSTGTTRYTLSFKNSALFLYAIQGAEKVQRYSRDTCREIVRRALGKYEASPELMRFAGGLYSSDGSFEVLAPQMLPASRTHLDEWQVGMVREVKRPLIAAIIEKKA
jgi:hypothetical protein